MIVNEQETRGEGMAELRQSSVDLTGFIDMHIHAGPDVRNRKLNDIQVAQAAAEAGMAAVLLKSHVTITADRAAMAQAVVPGIQVFGGVVLNEEIGGLNVAAVEAALKLGAREVWMPTLSAQGSAGRARGIVVTDRSGRLLPKVLDILKLIAEADIILGTGHLSLSEIVICAKEARRLGVRKVLVTHPERRSIRMPVDVQREMAEKGVLFERCYENALADPMLGVEGLAQMIRAVGPVSTVISSDLGQINNPPPVEGLRSYIAGLLSAGITWQEIRQMAVVNPSQLLDL